MTNDRQITTAEVAAAHGVSIRTVHRWIVAGRIKPVTKLRGKTGHYLFDPSALEPTQPGQAA